MQYKRLKCSTTYKGEEEENKEEGNNSYRERKLITTSQTGAGSRY